MTTWILSHTSVSHPIFVGIIIIRTIVTVYQSWIYWGQSPHTCCHSSVVNCYLISQEQAITCKHPNSIYLLHQVCLFVQHDIKYESSLKRTLHTEICLVTLQRGGCRKRYPSLGQEQLIKSIRKEDVSNKAIVVSQRMWNNVPLN